MGKREVSYLIDQFRESVKLSTDKDFLREIGRMPCFEITPVANYIAAQHGTSKTITIEEFPCIRPPFKKMWLEYNYEPPSGTYEKAYIGHLLSCTKANGQDYDYTLMIKIAIGVGDRITLYPYVVIIPFLEDGTPCGIPLPKGQSGKRAPFMVQYVGEFNAKTEEQKQAIQKETQEWGKNMASTIPATLVALSFMNCKNVSHGILREEMPKLNRSRAKKGKVPLLRMYTLKIGGIKEMFRKSGHGEGFSTTAFHICRGHFKDFTHGAGLFGRYKGRYWWPSQARGNRSAGIVKKEYEVTTNNP